MKDQALDPPPPSPGGVQGADSGSRTDAGARTGSRTRGDSGSRGGARTGGRSGSGRDPRTGEPSPSADPRRAAGGRSTASRDAAAERTAQAPRRRTDDPAGKGAKPRRAKTGRSSAGDAARERPAPDKRDRAADRTRDDAGEDDSGAATGTASAGKAAADKPVTSAAAAARTAGSAVWQALPPRRGVFTGRERELAELRSEIARPGLRVLGGKEKESGRVLLVAGRPGTGRTALALELARLLAADCPDGQLFVRLAPGQFVPRLPRPVAGGRVVLAVDGVTAADQLAGLLPLPAGSVLVATSEGPLSGVPDVRPCTLGGLDAPAAVALLAHTVGGTRVTNDPRGAETLVQELGGHPAALRLAAAWLAAQPRLSLAEAAARLRVVAPGAPSVGPGTPGELVRAFRAVYEALPSTAARILRMLVLAPAGRIDAQIASALAGCSVAAARSTLDDFVTCALLDRDDPPPPPAWLLAARGRPYDGRPTAPGVAPVRPAPAAERPGEGEVPAAEPHDPTAAGRPPAPSGGNAPGAAPIAAAADGGERAYRVPDCLMPLLRALVEQYDRPDDVRLARARMLERTVRLLTACRAALDGRPPADGLPRTLRFGSPREAAGWLAARVPSLMAAAYDAVADGELDTLARRLIAALVRAMVAASGGGPALAAERHELHTLVLGVAERRGLRREQAAALINLADLDAEAGRGEAALARYRQALDAARAGDDTEAEGRVLEALGGAYLARRDLPRACDWFGRALALRQGRGELAHQARLHARIGAVLTYQGSYGPALRAWRASAGLYRRLADLPAQARALAEAARVQEYAGHPEDALRTCRDALYWARQAGQRRLEAAVLLRLADALDRLGDTSGAELQRAAARKLCRPGELPAV